MGRRRRGDREERGECWRNRRGRGERGPERRKERGEGERRKGREAMRHVMYTMYDFVLNSQQGFKGDNLILQL